jgi:L-threonylcarbamoyladenylate synthase
MPVPAAVPTGAAFDTRIVVVDSRSPDESLLGPCADVLCAGGLVAFPTETVYGLGANALSAQAVAGIFTAKGRPADNPLIVHVASVDDVAPLVAGIPPLARILMDAFMPGPLTLVLRRSSLVPDLVTAGLDTVAVRVPSHPVARALIRLAGVPVAAPSANRSGRPSPTRAEHVLEDLAGRIPWLVDGGPCGVGLESTVVDATGEVPVILRPGAVTAEHLSLATGLDPIDASSHPGSTPRSPGLKYRHYAPRAVLRVADGPDDEARADRLLSLAAEEIAAGRRVGLFAAHDTLLSLHCPLVSSAVPRGRIVLSVDWGRADDALAASASLFDALRRLDEAGAEVIVAQSVAPEGIGAAYRNRLEKAAGGLEGEVQGS